ncbi:uncharacterized protein LOC128262523 [Drosophila gunungcola]|uniref:uncharacterized protein LOC128262523 n=1 Tax=Drosophila gunungcola TaxID=103775 RepID=UPI0022E84014|nr:uncharacterized protein LOC128262523 [Drosophila gunungcola]
MHCFPCSVTNCTTMEFTLLEIARDQWSALRDLYTHDRTNLTGFDLINYFINYKASSDADLIKIYTTDKDWITHGSYILIHQLDNRAYVYLNTLDPKSLEDLKALLCYLDLKVFHWICGYGEHLKPLVEQYWLNLGQDLCKLEHLGTIVYHLPKSKIPCWKPQFKSLINVGYLSAKHAALVDQHWAYRTPDSLPWIRGLIEKNASAGVFDARGELLAWCLRSPHGSLCNLHVLSSHRRQGLGSLAVLFMANEIKSFGSEVLATVVFDNEGSKKLFENLGFKPINKLYWAVMPPLH